MKKLNVLFDDSESEFLPVFKRYGGQQSPQPAYIFLDIRDGSIGADYNGEIGSTPIIQWNNIILTFPIFPTSTSEQITQIIEDKKELFQTVLDGSSIEWDGSNSVGVFDDSAKEALDKLGFNGDPEALQRHEDQINLIEGNDLPDFTDCLDIGGMSIDEFTNYILEFNGQDNNYFAPDIDFCGGLRDALRWIWLDHLYAGGDLPQIIARDLLENSDYSEAWEEELKGFALKD